MDGENGQDIIGLVAEAAKHAPLVVVCGTDEKQSLVHSKLTRVFLNGQDISRHMQKVEVIFDCQQPVGARLTYIGAAVVVTEGAQLELKQADIHVTCTECQKSLKGESEQVVLADVTRIGSVARERVVADVDAER